MPFSLPNLKFSTLSIDDTVKAAWNGEAAKVAKADASKKEAATYTAKKILISAVNDTMHIYTTEEEAYLVALAKCHETGKDMSKKALALTKEIQALSPTEQASKGNAMMIEKAVKELSDMAKDLSAMVDAIAKWRAGLVGHQGVRKEMSIPKGLEEELGDKFITMLKDNFARQREPMITGLSRVADSVTKVKDFQARVDDCLKSLQVIEKGGKRNLVELSKEAKEIQAFADKFETLKFPTVSGVKDSTKTLEENKEAKQVAVIRKTLLPTWAAQIKSARAYVKTITIKRDNFLKTEKDVDDLPGMPAVLKDIAASIKKHGDLIVDVTAAVDKCQKISDKMK